MKFNPKFYQKYLVLKELRNFIE